MNSYFICQLFSSVALAHTYHILLLTAVGPLSPAHRLEVIIQIQTTSMRNSYPHGHGKV